jgi:hypothetical protein
VKHPPNQGPDPDFNPTDTDIERLVRLALKLAPVNYHEGNGNGKFQKWMLTLMNALMVAAVVAAIGLYGKVSALEASVNANNSALHIQISRLEQQVDRLSLNVAPSQK